MIRITGKVFRLLDKRQQGTLLVITAMMLIGGIMESMSVSLILPLIEAVINTETWNEPFYAQIICKLFNIYNQRNYIETLLIVLVLLFIIKNIYLLFEYYLQYSFAAKTRFRIQRDLMHSYIKKPYTFFLNSSTGEIIRIITNDTAQAYSLLNGNMLFYTELIVSMILAITMIALSPQIAIGLILILCIEMLVIMCIIKPILGAVGEKERSESALSNKWALQSINGIKSIKVASKETFFKEKYDKHTWISVDSQRKSKTISNAPRLIIEAFTISGVLFIIFIMVFMGTEMSDIIPQLSAFAVAAVRLLPSANRISGAYSDVMYNEGAIDNIINILFVGEHIGGDANNRENECDKDKTQITFKKSLQLENITFSYPETEQKILDSADLVILPGQSIGIVGTSGAGKTTMVDIMLGLLKPQSGRVLVDGMDIEDHMSDWLSHIAYIPQSIFLMDDTIRANVAFGHDVKENDDTNIWKAIRDAQLEDFVMSLPQKLDTTVGEAGIRLSGGQRQRIGIARALYSNPDILFFDEATSALDSDTESAIMESVEHLKGRKTLITIAHRRSTIENCDVVYRVENGQILEENS